MTLRVIGAGLGRTGTLSLKLALESLGVGPCHHWVELNRHPGRARSWLDAVRRNRRGLEVDWEALFEGYEATVDWPGCAYACELKRVFPEARVVLTTRDPSAWYASVAATLLPLYRSMPAWLGVLLPAFGRLRTLAGEVIWGENGTFNNQFADRDKTMARFEAHQRKICDAVPAEDLLVFDVTQGYAPLCEFLGLPVPDTAFPRVNERAAITRNIRLLRLVQAVAVVALLALAAGLARWLAGLF